MMVLDTWQEFLDRVQLGMSVLDDGDDGEANAGVPVSPSSPPRRSPQMAEGGTP